ncbi:hypothetical protein D918_02102, partial [Trichuris suis]
LGSLPCQCPLIVVIKPPVCENQTRQLELVHVKPEPIAEGTDGENATESSALAAAAAAEELTTSSNASVSQDGETTEGAAEQKESATDQLSQDSVMPANSSANEPGGVDQADGSGMETEASGQPVSNPNVSEVNDTRSRRNVYSEPWFTDAPYFEMPSDLEADVSQEILVLDMGDTGSSLNDDEKSDMRMPIREAQEQLPESNRRVCLTSGALAAVVSGFVFVVILLSLAVFVMLIKRHHQARVNMMGTYSTCRAYKF